MTFQTIILSTILLLQQSSNSFVPSIKKKNIQFLARKNTIKLNSSTSSTNNIVLRPTTDDPNAFDSHKIGSARVHRFTTSTDQEIDYVMWYHARSSTPSSQNLPPLSTGEIGYALSRNGLHWEKYSIPSSAQEQLCLGVNDEAWWGFDTAHVGLGQVLSPAVSSPAMRTDHGVYLMYYMGGNKEERKVKDYISNFDNDEAKIMGMNMCIGIAISQDGIHWGRMEGDYPSGAVLVPEEERGELYCAWPDVIKIPAVSEKEDDEYIMYYSTANSSTKDKSIHYATSTDGFRWEKQGLCLAPSSEEDGMGCARSHVFYHEESEKYYLFYDGASSNDKKHRILCAVSENGKSDWKKLGIVLDLAESEDAWDFGGLSSPHIVQLDDGSLRMYYIGQDLKGHTSVGVAKTSSIESMAFQREQAEFSFSTIGE